MLRHPSNDSADVDGGKDKLRRKNDWESQVKYLNQHAASSGIEL